MSTRLLRRRRAAGLAFLVFLMLAMPLTVAAKTSLPKKKKKKPAVQKQQVQSETPLRPATMAAGVNAFGSKLLSALDAPAFVSPWGVAHALALLHEGAAAGSPSRRQIQAVAFGFSGAEAPLDAVRAGVAALAAGVVAGADGANLTVADANAAWVAPGLPLLDSYRAALAAHYAAEARPLTSAAAVNAWVSEATRGRIPSIIDEGTAARASLVLTNAVYFKALWEEPFPAEATAAAPFRGLDGGAARDVAMMQLYYKGGPSVELAWTQAALGGGGRQPCVATRMAYRGGTYAAVAAMPEGNLFAGGGPLKLASGVAYADALAACREAVVAGLAAAAGAPGALAWARVGPAAEVQRARILLPRFEIEWEASLVPALRAAGLTAPFAPGDFTGVAGGAAGAALAVSDVVHKVFAKVDEQGTEAAAATSIVMVTSVPATPPKEVELRFDRPFAFAVVAKAQGLALFVGEVAKPEEWKG